MLHIYPMCGVFYLPQHRTLNTRHPLALHHMRLTERVAGAGFELVSSCTEGEHANHCPTAPHKLYT